MKNAWKSIVVAIADPARGKHLALRKAAAIAERCGAHITLFNSFMLPPPPNGKTLKTGPQLVQASIALREKRLQKLAAPLRKRGIAVSCVAVWDFPPHEAVVREVIRSRADIVVAESSRRGKLARWFLANTDWELIRSCPCPLWFVRSAELPKSSNVLVAVDPRHTHAKPSQLDDRLLAMARQIKRSLKATVNVAHAYELPIAVVPTMMEPAFIATSPREAARIERHMKRLVAGLVKKYSVDPKYQHVLVGDASFVLPKLAEKLRADVLLMGAVSRSRARIPFIGNTAERVIDHVGCDVLIVKPASFKTTVERLGPHL